MEGSKRLLVAMAALFALAPRLVDGAPDPIVRWAQLIVGSGHDSCRDGRLAPDGRLEIGLIREVQNPKVSAIQIERID